ncbi:MAG: hypothetical protein WCP19_04390 [Chloroflexota bacterium]
MNNARPKTITVILVCLLLLALISAAGTITNRIGFGGRNNFRTANGTNQAGSGNFQGGNNGNFQGNGNNSGSDTNGQGTNGNFQRRNSGGFNIFSITRSLGLPPNVMIYFSIGFAVIGIALLVLSVYGIWKSQVWGLNLGMVMAAIFLIGAIPGLLSIGGRNMNWFRTISNIISLLAALPVLALGLLPSVRDYFPKKSAKK